MKDLNNPFKFMFYAISKALLYPLTPISYYVCECGCRFTASNTRCPKCGEKVGAV